MVERNGSAALSRTLLTTVTGILTTIIIGLGAIMIQAIGDIRQDLSEIKGSLPHRFKTINRRLDMLERAGLVERRPDPDDRRSTLVVLTAAGERRAVEAARIHVAAESELFDPLGPADLAALCGLLERMLSSRVFVGPASIVTNDSSCRTDQRS